jgi:hypothetical protein
VYEPDKHAAFEEVAMHYTMTKPCPECPFRRTEGAVRLRTGRIEEVAGSMLGGRSGFPCHLTTVPVADAAEGECDRVVTADSVHCAGALIFAEKNGQSTQMMRIAGRLGLYDSSKLDQATFAEVFDDIDEMLETAVDRNRPRRRGRR